MKAVSGKTNSSALLGTPNSSKCRSKVSELMWIWSVDKGTTKTLGRYLCIEWRQVWPWIIVHRLLVNLNLSKTIDPWADHISPRQGESPCTNKLEEGKGSPAPATIHFELENKVLSLHISVAVICCNYELCSSLSWLISTSTFSSSSLYFSRRLFTVLVLIHSTFVCRRATWHCSFSVFLKFERYSATFSPSCNLTISGQVVVTLSSCSSSPLIRRSRVVLPCACSSTLSFSANVRLPRVLCFYLLYFWAFLRALSLFCLSTKPQVQGAWGVECLLSIAGSGAATNWGGARSVG